jgi:uncharacterized protein (DUF1697 family)
MNLWIAFLRGINVGGRHIVPMRELKNSLAGMGCGDVCSYIQSGNLVFRHKEADAVRLAAKISTLVAQEYGFEPKVLLLDPGELQNAISANPFPEATCDPKSVLLFFLAEIPHSPELDGVRLDQSVDEAFHLEDRVFYLYAPGGIGRSKLATRVERHLQVTATARNLRTASKVLALAETLG